MLKFFLSIKTFLWLTGLCLIFFVVGSFFIPQNLDVFSEINEMPLFSWFSKNMSELDTSFWIYMLIGFMTLIALNTVICTADALLKRVTWKAILQSLSPHILHIGVLLILFGHLVSASSGYKADIPLGMREIKDFQGFQLGIQKIEFVTIIGEDSTRWRVHLTVNDKPFILEPARPAFYKKVGFFAKSAQQKKMTAIIGLVYDPGVLWELIGAGFFLLGTLGIAWSQMKIKGEING